jgi:membrane-bound lytic murein transglycosylase D
MAPRLVSFENILKMLILSYILWWSLPTATECLGANKDAEDFPIYPSIRNNVQFWERIYTHYSVNQAVIHDSQDLSKIYEVITLLDRDLPNSQKSNAIAERSARERYEAMLSRLSRQPPATPEEKRIAGLFGGRCEDMARASQNVRSQCGLKERFAAGVSNSGLYIKEIKKIFRTYRLPEDLAYLAHVESSFNLHAYSKVGAAGIWQFTRETGKRYMTIDYVVDDRLDPIRATHAAAQYLQNSYRSLENWPLAITSYNYGLAGMVRAANELENYEKIFQHYNKGYFKFASKNFYSEFLAAVRMAKMLEANGNVRLAPESSYHYVNLPGYAHVNDISRYFGISVATVKELNPALLPPVINGEKHIPKGYSLRLPGSHDIQQKIASLSPALFKHEQKASMYHTVKKGDTINSIARLHGVSPDNLRRANDLTKYAKLHVKQNLRIPAKAQSFGSLDNSGRKKTAFNMTSSSFEPANAFCQWWHSETVGSTAILS